MQPSTKKRLEIAAALLIILALLILIWFLFRQPSEPEEVSEPDEVATTVPELTTDDIKPDEPVESLPQTTVRVFIERFGSFSSESDYSNVEDVMALVTPALQNELQALAEEARASSGGAYYGVSTYIVTMTEIARTDTTASYSVTTQREEAIESPGNISLRYQDIEISLVKDGLDWLVSDYYWSD